MALRFLFMRVALRKESVDRNIVLPLPKLLSVPSLSARRAWIEIVRLLASYAFLVVALRKESVDRNSSGAKAAQTQWSRSPQGERG